MKSIEKYLNGLHDVGINALRYDATNHVLELGLEINENENIKSIDLRFMGAIGIDPSHIEQISNESEIYSIDVANNRACIQILLGYAKPSLDFMFEYESIELLGNVPPLPRE
jgi:hypothetical protein